MLGQAEHLKACVRAKVEHPFRVLKWQFGFTKVHYKEMAKNTAQLMTLFAMSNLWMAKGMSAPAVRSEATMRHQKAGNSSHSGSQFDEMMIRVSSDSFLAISNQQSAQCHAASAASRRAISRRKCFSAGVTMATK
jgi:IS5 family transposase